VSLKGNLQVKPAKDGVFQKITEPSTGWTNKVQLEHAAGHVWGPSSKADCIKVAINPGVGPLTAVILLQISGQLEVQTFWRFLLSDPPAKTLWANVLNLVFVETFPRVA
jgi:hypothetical protein